jgi:hypothetical protein
VVAEEGEMTEQLTCDMFSEHVGETFRLALESGDTLDLELIEAELSRIQETKSDRAPFALVFRGDPETVLPQCLYHLKHDTMGDVSLFLVPIGPDEQGMQYEAVFN